MPGQKQAVTQVRLSANQKQLIAEASGLEGVGVSQFVREAAYARALHVLIDHNSASAEVRRLVIALARRSQDPEIIRLTHLLLSAATGV